MRRLPSNVEKADLIQVGLIAVAQAALGFEWPGDHDSREGMDAFVRYARMRVKGAMIDELRQLDHLTRSQRRQVKVIQIARERWRAAEGSQPSLAELSSLCGIGVDDIARLEQAAWTAQTESLSEDDETDSPVALREPATAQDEVEARVDTAIVMRRLEKFFSTLPPRDRQVIDAYLGIGLTPLALAGELGVSRSRISQIYKRVCGQIAGHFGLAEPGVGEKRAADRPGKRMASHLDEMIELREAQLAAASGAGRWGELIESALTLPPEEFGDVRHRTDGQPKIN